MSIIGKFIHCLHYGTWLSGQIIKESVVMAMDTLGSGRHIAPVVIYYPLRVTSERDIAGFIASITMTPGTLSLGVTGPKEVDYDAAAGNRGSDASAVAASEFKTHGLSSVQRFLAVHAMYGENPQELLDGLMDMEERLAPHVKDIEMKFDVEHLVERGRKGPRGFRGSRGGRASDETVFDVEKADSTPHAAAFVAAILEANDEEKDVEELENMDRKERYEVARRNAERNRSDRNHEPQDNTPRPDIDTFEGDNLGASYADRQGRTKPGETLYDPLYPENNPHDPSDVDGSKRWKTPPRHWSEVQKEEQETQKKAAKRKRRKRKDL